MDTKIDYAVNEAYLNLVDARKAAELLTGPVEDWPLLSLRTFFVSAARFVKNANTLVRANGATSIDEILSKPLKPGWIEAVEYVLQTLSVSEVTAGTAKELERSGEFYRRMMSDDYQTVGQVVAALRKREIPRQVVLAATAGTYLHKPVRDAIQAGYGITPLEPPKKSI